MPKLIQPKRLNKNITVQQYWDIRDKLKAPKKSQPIQAFRQEEVANRFRYLKPTQQAKFFNPLSYFFKSSTKTHDEQQQYAAHFKEKDATFTNEFLSSLRYRLSGPLIPIKKFVFGLKSIIYNHEAILNVLLKNLYIDESWPLLQCVIKDTNEHSFEFFMSQGLKKLAYQGEDQNGRSTSIYSNYFHQSRFQTLFETLAIFMEANYEKIMQNLREFFNEMNKQFFNHQNKYIRKFSMKSVSYIINNLSLEDNLSLIFSIVLSGSISSEGEQIPIGELLLNRHKAVKGCLSSVEINNVIETLKQLPLFMSKNLAESEMEVQQSTFKQQLQTEFKLQLQDRIDNILTVYIAGILDLLETKFGRAEESETNNEILFDLNYCIKAFIVVQQKSNSQISQLTLIKAFHHYLSICDQKRFLTHNPKHQAYINETFKLILTHLQTSTLKVMETEQKSDQKFASSVSQLLGLCFKICPKVSAKFLLSKSVIHYCKFLGPEDSLNLVSQIHCSSGFQQLDRAECKTLGDFLFITFSKFIKYFFESTQGFNQDNQVQLLYTIYMILKRISFNNTINLNYLGLNKNQIIKKVESINEISDFFVFSKLISLVNLQAENDQQFSQNFSSSIMKTFESLIKPFTESLMSIIGSECKSKESPLFSYNNHIQDLLRYSHHEVEWVNVAYNLEECCKNLMRKVSLNSQKSKQKWVWSDLSLNRAIEINQKQDLNSIFAEHSILLQSRNRMTRKSVLERIVNLWPGNSSSILKSIIERMRRIDSDEIDLSNERDAKKEFVSLEQEVSEVKESDSQSRKVIKLIVNWILGFSFTGFKLINDNIVSLSNGVFDLFPSEVSGIVLPFVSYYIYRHSRQFEFDTTQSEIFVLKTPKKVEAQLNSIKEKQKLYSLVKEDFSTQDQITIEWIGLERIANSIGRSKKFKNNPAVKKNIEQLLKSYFEEEFNRKINVLSSYHSGQEVPNSHLILQPKTRFLAIMLKLCPSTYLPPYQCLHYLAQEFLGLDSIQNIKKNRWQALWDKKAKGSKSRQEITDTVNTTISLDKMSMQEQYLYAHFLWKQLIEGSQQKRRSIFQHIRDRVPDVIPYLFSNILYREMFFVTEPEKYFQQIQKNPQLLNELIEKLFLENKKTLLNMMYLLKAIIVVFKNFLRNSIHIINLVIVLRCMIKLLYQKTSGVQKHLQEQIDEEQLEEQANEDEEEKKNEQEQEEQEKSSFALYKPHRKQLYKVLTEIFTHYSLEYEQADRILSDLSRSYLKVEDQNNHSKEQKIFAKIAYASVNSVPGILILLKVISQEPFYHHLLLKFGIFDLVASVIDITDIGDEQKMEEQKNESIRKKQQSNPHAINTCLEIISNILHINEQKSSSKMDQQSQEQIYIKSHYTKWTSSIQVLLNSINHYFLYSKNLSEKSQNRSSTIELDYYSYENKQNINSIKNNKNRSKKEHDRNLNEGRNLDLMWLIVAEILNLPHHRQNTISNHSQYLLPQITLKNDWEQIFWSEINKIIKIRQFKQKQYSKLSKIIEISLVYFRQQLSQHQPNNESFSQKSSIEEFLCKIISVLPHINQLSERVKLTEIIHKGILATSNLRLIDQEAINTVTSINAVKKVGLNVEVDFDQFFGALAKYSQENVKINTTNEEMEDENKKELNLLSHQYIIYNLLPYLTSEELSVRKAVRETLNSFLIRISVHLKKFESETLKVYNSILRLLIQQLKRNEIDSVFWSILGSIGLCIRFSVKFSDKFQKTFENYFIYSKLLAPLVKVSENEVTFESQSEEDFFHMITSLSQGNKMKALKMLKERSISMVEEKISDKFKEEEKGCCLPHPLPFILATLEHLVLPAKHFQNQCQYNVQGNLSSTLTHISLQIFESIVTFARESLVKKELKRLASKIKFNEQQKSNSETLKTNILVIKIISSIVEGINTLEKCTTNIKKYVSEYGFDEFHSKLIKTARTLNQETQEEQSDSDDDQEEEKKKVEFFQNLEDLEPQEAINRNFMLFDKKLMTMQEKEQREQSNFQSSPLINFLKMHVLIPLKLMLFYENKSNKEAKEEEDKSRIMISVAITKILIKFPMEIFLFEFQKVLSKICRLMKKRQLEVRQNGRKSLCQIAKIVGPQMLYAIILELKFHLRDNFQRHIFNFTVYEIIQAISPLKHGEIDYCLPLILPMIIDEIFGQSNDEKKMVETNEVPVLNMETKKKKGHELLVMISRQISVERIRYLIEYLEKFLREFLNSETNLSKYDTVVNNITNGLGQNEEFISQQNAGLFGEILCNSMYELRKEIKIYNFEDESKKITPESTTKINTEKSKKTGKETLLLQEEVARNGSIFKKMSRQVYEKRNKEIMINCLVQFYLAFGSLLIRKQVICIKTLENSKHLTQKFIKIMQFVFECMDHRDNRIVCKSMRLLHQALILNYEKSTSEELKESTKQLRKKVSRKILLFIEKLTSSDPQLLKESFTILIDLFTHVTITKEFLPSIISIIKLHTNNESDEANIPQPYRLLKLIIYKLPESIYDHLIYDMYQLVRINVVNCSAGEIRDVCKSIAMTYVRRKEFLITGIELSSNQEQKDHPNYKNKPKAKLQEISKERKVEHEYSQRIKNELNFYLSNLDCKLEENQLLVLEIINEWITNRTKTEIQEVSELILLSLATSLINGNECVEKINKIMNEILQVVDKAKVYEVLEKTLVWIAQPREKNMIRECGYLLLSIILESKSIQIDNQTVKTQYFFKSPCNNVILSVQTLINEEVDILNDYLVSKKQNGSKKVQNQEWNLILDAIQVPDSNPYLSQNQILQYCLDVLTLFAEFPFYRQQLKQKHIVFSVWKLLKTPKKKICQKVIQFLERIDNLAVNLSSETESQSMNKKFKEEEEAQKKTRFNLKSTLATLINNQTPKETIEQLLKKLHSEPIGDQSFVENFELLLSFLNKLVTKFKIMESKAEIIYYLLNRAIIQNKDKNELIFKNQELQIKCIDTLGKVSRNQFISLECKTLNEETMNLVKEIVGVSDFFKKLTKLQSERREKKSEQKANLAILAVTDQKAYIEAKRKKIKTQ